MKGKILMFHRVLPIAQFGRTNAYKDRGTLISLSFFESIIKKIVKSKKRVVTMVEYHKLQQAKKATSAHVVLTFDDGYKDNYDYIIPILEKYNLKGTFYPTLKYCFEECSSPLDDYYSIGDQLKLNSEQRQNWVLGKQKKQFLSLSYLDQSKFNIALAKKNKTQPLKNRLYMSKTHLKKVLSLGHEIGAHSYHHPLLPLMDEKELRFELELTSNCLNQLDVPRERTFAYPDGAYNNKVISFIDKDFLCACTVEHETSKEYSPFEIPRYFIYPNRKISKILSFSTS
jgi:peptidoglycan/xylan/chitin deacetylase (PgdA/CDA1 family)